MTERSEAGTEGSDEPEVRFEVSDGVARITLDRPHRRNATTRPQRLRIIELLDEASARLDVRVVVLTGSGGSFCAGADLAAPLPGPPRPAGAPARTVGEVAGGMRMNAHRLIGAIMDCEKPVIAAVNGVAAGMGVHMALACDLVLAAESATLREVFVHRGVVPDSGGAYLLGRLIGPQKAKELLFFGRTIDAVQAERMGLVNRVAPDDAFDALVHEWASELAAGPTRTIALCKSLVNRSLDLGRDDSLALESFVQDMNMATVDAGEGVSAFLERRPTDFVGW